MKVILTCTSIIDADYEDIKALDLLEHDLSEVSWKLFFEG